MLLIGVEVFCEEIVKDCGERLTLFAAAGASFIVDVARVSGLDLCLGWIVIGFEGDFMDEELKVMIVVGVWLVGLGLLCLRVETAVIFAFVVVSAFVEEKGVWSSFCLNIILYIGVLF